MDGEGNAQGLGEAFRILDFAHDKLHELEEVAPGAPTLTMALNEREILLVCAALPALEVFYPCLHGMSVDFQRRVVELAQVQQPDFSYFDYGREGPSES